MRDDAGRLAREYFVGLWGEPGDQMRDRIAHAAFDRLAGVVDHLDPAVPERDLAVRTAVLERRQLDPKVLGQVVPTAGFCFHAKGAVQ